MIKEINKIFFIGFFISIFFTLIIAKIFNIGVSIGNNIFFLVLICLIPFVEKILNFIKTDSKKIDFGINKNDNLFKYSCLAFLLFILFFFSKTDFFQNLTIFLFAFGIIFKIEERYFFSVSLFLLFFTIVQIIFGNKQLAEVLSIYVYYYLIIGVIISIINGYSDKNTEILEENKNTKKEKKKKNLETKKFNFLEIDKYFIYYFGIILTIIYFGKNEYIANLSILFFTFYLIGNFFGNNICLNLEKEPLQKCDEKKFIITSCLFGVIIFQVLVGENLNYMYIFNIILFFLIMIGTSFIEYK